MADGSDNGQGGAQGGDGGQPSAEEMMQPAEIDNFNQFGAFLLDKADAYWTGFLQITPLLIVASVVLAFTWLAAKAVSGVVRLVAGKLHSRQAIIDLLGVIAKTVVWIIGSFAALSIVFPSINPGSLITGAGLGAAVIGIAFKDVFENFLAGFLILARRTMRIGDYIDCEDIQGKIIKTTLRDTYLRRTDEELVVVPNSYLFKNPVRVWTDPDYRRYDLAVGVAYKEDVAESRRIIKEAADSIDLGSNKEVQVFATAFGASSIDFNVRFWTAPQPIEGHRKRDEMVEAIKAALDNAGIEIPFPYRTLTFDEPLPVRQEPSESGTDAARDRDSQSGAANGAG